MQIKRSQMQEFECHKFSAFASDLGWRPGDWPTTVETDAGNGRPFHFVDVDLVDDLVAVNYRQSCGCISLRVFND